MEDSAGKMKVAAGILGSLGLLVTAVQNLTGILSLFEERFWVVIAVGWLASIVSAWPKRISMNTGFQPASSSSSIWKKSILPYRIVVLVSLIWGGIAGWRYWEQRRSIRSEMPPITSPQSVASPMQEPLRTIFEEQNTTTVSPRILRFELDQTKTSYVPHPWPIPVGKKEVLIPGYLLEFAFDDYSSWSQGFAKSLAARCKEQLKDGHTLPSVRWWALKGSRQSLLKYVENDNLLLTLPVRRPDVTRKLLPYGSEWEEIRSTSVGNYEQLLAWVRNCIGIPFPVFTFVVENPSERQMVVTQLRYYVIYTIHTL